MTAVGRGCRTIAVALALLGVGSAKAETVERCNVSSLISMGRLLNTEVPQRFAEREGGVVNPRSAERVKLRIQGCDPAARYRLSMPNGYQVRNGEKSVTVWPVVVAVNGVARNPQSVAGPGNSIDLEGNPELDLVIAIDPADSQSLTSSGAWSGTGMVLFEDR
ncbi:hypothetical protein M2333_000235 [Sphingobium sp. B11D3B]|uniref:hypothetical protein n=1 Tax=Sphingobium sp. B11D3B TaxID=2940575 RepID=UPI002225D1C4|nr:hypothetical protein [Sphingobium sp. B11D3B]MCW2387189.1 hypothetical protein [Sphingobium sp. B11D3B]